MGPALPFSTQQLLPWPEAITLTSVRTNSSNVVANVSNAGVYQTRNAEAAPTKGVYTQFDILVSVGTDSIPFTPKPADTIQWQGDTYTVLSVEASIWTLVAQIHARNLILAFDLRDTGILTRPTLAQNAKFRQSLAAYETIASGIPCRLQPQGGDAIDVFDRKTIPQRFTAYLGVQVTAQAKDVFTVDDVDYTVVGFHNPARIDSLMTLDCELVL